MARLSAIRAALAALLLGLILAAFTAPPARAQSFGRNKVQYESLDWSVLETPHVRLHYYAQEESLARSLAAFAESVTVEYDRRFALHPKPRVPLLLYSTHHLFQQTNATPELLTESVGGLTELVKGRVLIPHNGSWARLRWVTRHELTHWYMLQKLASVNHIHHRVPTWFPPLWFTEGIAEYCGAPRWDADAEGLLRDMVTSNMAYPVTRSEPITGSVEMYKEGQAFLLWLSDKYGEHLLFQLLENAWRADDFETCFRLTYGRKLADVDDEWFASIRKHYLPAVGTNTRPAEVARGFAQRSRFNLGPRALPAAPADSDTTVRFCFFEVNDGATDLVVSEPVKGGRRERRLLRGGGTASFESFHLFQNRPAVSASGRIALASKHGGRDALYVLDPHSGAVLRRLEFPELVAIHDPSLVPGDRAVVFSAQDYDGRSDIYRASWDGPGLAKLERLTHDDFDDVDPAVSPDGAWVAFASDRCDANGNYALYRLPLAGGVPEQLSFPPGGDDRQPAWSPDGKWLAFRSTRSGTSDLWVRVSTPSHEARRVTHMLGPVTDPDWTPNGRGLLFTGEDHVTFRSFAIHVAPESLTAESETPPPALAVLPVVRDDSAPQYYQRRLGIDFVQNAIGSSPTFNSTLSFGQVAVSDVLGNEQYLLTLANDSERFGDFWNGWEGGLTYLNQAQRLNYGIGVFRLTSLYDPDFDLIRREPRIGILGLASYPFNAFERIEASVEVLHASHHLLRAGGAPSVDLVTNEIGLVHDAARWTWDGPVGGTRVNVNAGFTRDMSTGLASYGTVSGEIRHYRQPLPGVVLATRASGWSSYGRDAQRFYLGGPIRLHVVERRFVSGLQTVSAQQELRFPMVRGLTLGIPAPWQLPTIGGAVFADGAWAYDHGDRERAGVVGWALYLGGGLYPAIRWNWTWLTTDFQKFDNRRPRMIFTLAYNY